MGGNQEADTIEGLTQKRFAPRENGVLLGSVLSVQASRQPCQSRPFAAGEHYPPGMGRPVIVRQLLHGWIGPPGHSHHEMPPVISWLRRLKPVCGPSQPPCQSYPMHLGRLTSGFVGGVVTMSNWGEACLEIVQIPSATYLLGNSNLTLQELHDEPRSMSQGLESPTRISLVARAYDLQFFDYSGRQTTW